MNKYRIKVEALDGNKELNERYADGIECDGFVIIGHEDDGNTVAIEHLTIDDISSAIANNNILLASGVLAKAKNDVDGLCKRNDMEKKLRSLFSMDD